MRLLSLSSSIISSGRVALCGPSQSQRMDLDLTQRVSPSVHPKAELALAALQMRLRGARCTKEGRKDQKRILQRRLSSSSSYFFSVPLSLSYALRSQRISQRGEHILRIHFLDYRERTSRRRRPRHRGIWLARTLLRLRCRSPEGVPGQARTQPQLSSKRPFALPATTLIIMFAQSIVHRQIETFASSTAAMKSKSRNRFRERVSLIFRPVLWHAITRKRPLSVLSSFFRWSLKCVLFSINL